MIDTKVLTGAMLSGPGDNRKVIRACLERRVRPIIGQALICEYEDVLSRKALFLDCVLSAAERNDVLDALLAVSEWVKIYYSWRPNLRDEGDNHLVELAVAGSADMIVTHKAGDLMAADLRFPGLSIVRPHELLKELR